MKLIITRHGETEENVKKIFQGHIPGKLTKLGKEQAKKLAKRLKNEKIDVIFSSDLARAADTAKEIAKFHPNVPIYFVKELRERFLGSLQGKSHEELRWNEIDDKDLVLVEAKAEEIPAIINRAKNFQEKLLKKFHGKKVLLVTHGEFISAINAYILKEDWLKMHIEKKPSNTSVTIFEFDKDKNPKLKLMNCTKHLEE